MKTTNYEISKKLKEIGYVGKTDLETLINVLPKQYKDKFGDTYYLTLTAYSIYYEGEFSTSPNQHTTVRKEKESLADTAGRLIIRLWEFQTFGEGRNMKKKLLKFKK